MSSRVTGERRLSLEEPFAREDYQSPARLATDVDIPITGGEGYRGLGAFLKWLIHKSYDILRPEGIGSGGILTCMKVGALAQAFGAPLHPPRFDVAPSRRLAPGDLRPRIQVAVTCAGVASSAAGRTVVARSRGPQSKELFSIRDGVILAPEQPGIRLDVDEDAVERFRR